MSVARWNPVAAVAALSKATMPGPSAVTTTWPACSAPCATRASCNRGDLLPESSSRSASSIASDVEVGEGRAVERSRARRARCWGPRCPATTSSGTRTPARAARSIANASCSTLLEAGEVELRAALLVEQEPPEAAEELRVGFVATEHPDLERPTRVARRHACAEAGLVGRELDVGGVDAELGERGLHLRRASAVRRASRTPGAPRRRGPTRARRRRRSRRGRRCRGTSPRSRRRAPAAGRRAASGG